MNSRVRLFSVLTAIALAACGGDSDEDIDDSHRVVYDESVSGPLPHSLQDLPSEAVASITFALRNGTSVIRGNSQVGEVFLISVPAGSQVQSITIEYANHFVDNGHVLFLLRYPFGPAAVTNTQKMVSVGVHQFTVTPLPEAVGPGVYEVFSGASTTSDPPGNRFSVGITLAKLAQ